MKLLALMGTLTLGWGAGNDAAVNAVMRHNFDALQDLQVLVCDAEAFRSDDNKDEIKRGLAKLREVGEALPALVETRKPDLKAIAQVFRGYMTSTERNFKEGHRDYARAQLQAATGFCMACHTRSQGMKAFAATGDERIMKARLTDLQRAEYFAATRQFDKALQHYDRAVSAADAGATELRDVAHAARAYLSIAVRVKEDPKAAFAFITKISGIKGMAQFYASDMAQWKKDLSSWMQEKKTQDRGTPETLMAQARALVARGRKSQSFPADHAGDISYLRATNALHSALEVDPRGKFKAEAFELLGVSYAALSDALLWDLGTLYLEACVREAPHTPRARECYRRFSAEIYQGYSGSGGTYIPPEESRRLAELRKLAGS